jgi:hypothetical protein
VHAGDDDNRLAVDAIEEPVRKPPRNQSAASVAVEDGEGFGILGYPVVRNAKRLQKLFAQARLLRLVPLMGVLDVGGGRRPDDDSCHRC